MKSKPSPPLPSPSRNGEVDPGFRCRGYLLDQIYPDTHNPLKKALLQFLSRGFLQAARREIRFFWLALLSAFKPRYYNTNGRVFLNIAPGSTAQDLFFNIDAYYFPGIDAVVDCRRGLPFRDCVFQGVFSEHYIEHLDYVDELGGFLNECRRVLVDGGTLRLVTPDAAKYFQNYVEAGFEKMMAIRHAPPGYYNTRAEIINELFHQGTEHKFIFDGETLAMRCRAAGFASVEICEYRKGRNPALLIDREERRGESLYVEATK